MLPSQWVLGEFDQRDQRSNSQTVLRIEADPAQISEPLNDHQSPWVNNISLHHRQQVAAARKNFGISPLRTQQSCCLSLLLWTRILKGSHACAPSAVSSACKTCSGVSGKNGTRTPIALATAFEIAAPGDTVGGSPNPMTPISSYPGPVIMWTTRSPISPIPARR